MDTLLSLFKTLQVANNIETFGKIAEGVNFFEQLQASI